MCRNLYNMLSSMMMGDPIEECDCKTSDYLQNVYVVSFNVNFI